MRRHQMIVWLVAGMLVSPPMHAPLKAETPAEAAARQEMEDNVRRMNARVDDLFAAIESLQKRFTAMHDEMRKLSEEVARAADKTKDSAAQENVKQLGKAIEEVDKKRIADRDKLLNAFADLEKSIATMAKDGTKPAPNTASKTTKPKDTAKKNTDSQASPAAPEKGYEYVVQEGDYLKKIVDALNKQGMKMTSKQIADANPTVNWNRLQIGQKIFIPSP